MFFGVGPQAGSGAGGAGLPDRDRVGNFHCQAARHTSALGYQGAAVEHANGALAGTLDSHGCR